MIKQTHENRKIIMVMVAAEILVFVGVARSPTKGLRDSSLIMWPNRLNVYPRLTLQISEVNPQFFTNFLPPAYGSLQIQVFPRPYPEYELNFVSVMNSRIPLLFLPAMGNR